MTDEEKEVIKEELTREQIWEAAGAIASGLYAESIKTNTHPVVTAYAGIELTLHSIFGAEELDDDAFPEVFKQHIADSLRSIADDIAPAQVIQIVN